MKKREKKSGSFVIPKRAFLGIAPGIAIIGILISKRQPGPLLLFFVGIACGVLIMKGWME